MPKDGPYLRNVNATLSPGSFKQGTKQTSTQSGITLTPKALPTSSRAIPQPAQLPAPPKTPNPTPPASSVPPATPVTPPPSGTLFTPTPFPSPTPSAPHSPTPFHPTSFGPDGTPHTFHLAHVALAFEPSNAVPPPLPGGEVAVYRGIYASPKGFDKYGHSNHGDKSSVIWDTWKIRSILDVGCGYNEFCRDVRSKRPWIMALGVDFACPGADALVNASKMPFEDRQFDLLTSFDMLEHLRPEEVDDTLREFERVSSTFVLSISCRPSRITFAGRNLHPTVQPKEWWLEKLAAHGASDVKMHGRYIFGRWKDAPNGFDIINRPPPVPATASVVLVGNGPSLLGSGLGDKIDSFDWVIRFNKFKTLGHEQDCGSKLSYWSTFGRGQVPEDGIQPNKIIFLHGLTENPAIIPRQMWRIPSAVFTEAREDIRNASRLADTSKVIPSSGYVMARYLIGLAVEHIHLAGFSHFSKETSGQHHYWDPKTYGKPKEHDGDAEAALFADLVAEGKITYI